MDSFIEIYEKFRDLLLKLNTSSSAVSNGGSSSSDDDNFSRDFFGVSLFEKVFGK